MTHRQAKPTSGPDQAHSTTSDVTLVVACYNHENFLEQCLESIAAQTHAPKLIVTDDASHDSSQQLILQTLDRLGLRAHTIFHAENRGICSTFNEALSHVDTDFVAFLAADDWLAPDRVAAHRATLLATDGTTALTYGDMYLVDDMGRPFSTWSKEYGDLDYRGSQPDMFRRVIGDNFVPAPSIMSRTDSLRSIGGFDEDLSFEDLDMCLRLSRTYRFQMTPGCHIYYRMHGASMSSQEIAAASPRTLETMILLYRKHLGVHPETDTILTRKLFDLACQGYWAGLPGSLIRPHLRRYAVRHRSLHAAAFFMAATLPESTRALGATRQPLQELREHLAGRIPRRRPLADR